MKIPTRDEQNRWLDAYVKPLMQGDLATLADNYHRRSDGLLTRTELVDEIHEIQGDLVEADCHSDEQSGRDVRSAVQRLSEVIGQAELYLSSDDEVSEVGEAIASAIFGLEYVQEKDQPRIFMGWSLAEESPGWKLPNDHLLSPAKPYSERNDQDLYTHLTEKLQRLDDLETGKVTEKGLERRAKYELLGRKLQNAETDEERSEIELESFVVLLGDLQEAILDDPELLEAYVRSNIGSPDGFYFNDIQGPINH